MPPKEAADAGAGYAAGVKAEVSIARARADVAHRQAELEERALVNVPRGNVSARVASAALFVIAPAESAAERVSPERTVLCGLDGTPVPEVPGQRAGPLCRSVHPRRDLPDNLRGRRGAHRLAVRPGLGARGEDLPALTVAAAEESGAPHPGPRVDMDLPDGWGTAIASALAPSAGACVVAGMGVFAVGATLREAVRRAAAVEVAARHACLTVLYAPDSPPAVTAPTADRLRLRAQRDRIQTPDVFAYGPGLSHN